MKNIKKSIYCNIVILLISNLVSMAIGQEIPEIPEIDSVSVNKETGNVIIGWSVENPESIDGYLIYRQIFGVEGMADGDFYPIDTIFGGENMIYVDSSDLYVPARPSQKTEFYFVSSFSLIENGSTFRHSITGKVHSTIFLSIGERNDCEKSITLQWNLNQGWTANQVNYKVYFSTDDQNSYSLATETQDTTYTHININPLLDYWYYIHAINKKNSAGSTSNIALVEKNSSYRPVAEKFRIRQVGTVSNENIEIEIDIADSSSYGDFYLLKALNGNSIFDTIYNFSNGKSFVRYTDQANPTDSVYQYKLAVKNSCGIIQQETKVHHNILLKMSLDDETSNNINLSWNSYINWDTGVDAYNVFRTIQGEKELLTINDPEITSYIDNIKNLSNREELPEVCYRIEAVEKQGQTWQEKGISQSNMVCYDFFNSVRLPNAINPLSTIEENRIFLPKLGTVDNYKLIIYNRWGGRVFVTDDHEEGWDGTTRSGTPVPRGSYVYFMTYDKNGKRKTVKDVINVIYQ
jgi:gliding motility-associated-like protein